MCRYSTQPRVLCGEFPSMRTRPPSLRAAGSCPGCPAPRCTSRRGSTGGRTPAAVPRCAATVPPLAADLEGEVVPVDHALAHGGVAAQEVVTLVIDQHVEHLAHAASQPECLTPLDVKTVRYLDQGGNLDVHEANASPRSGAGHEPAREILPDLGDLAHPLHLQDHLRQQLALAAQ